MSTNADVNHRDDVTGPALAGRVRDLMPRLTAELAGLVAIPSVSEPGFAAASRPALLQARDAVAALFADAGCEQIGSLDLPDTAPMVTAEIPAPAGAPTVLLYSHYDVVPAGWGAETVTIGAGGSIPLVSSLAQAVPDAEILLVGTADGYANIHGPNERVLLDEFEKATLAEADLFGRLADSYRGGSH